MKKKQILGLAAAAIIFIVVGIASVLTNKFTDNMFKTDVRSLLTGSETEFNPPMSDYVAVVRVEGTIQQQTDTSVWSTDSGYQHTSTMSYIDKLIKDKNNKGIMLYVDSPGGAVYESEELYDKLMEYKEKTKRPVYDYMAYYAASGGYMTSVAADKIYANKNTTTGSIGVIMSGYDMTGLYEKLGIRYVSITSGKNKDSSKMTDEQIAIYQTQINEIYQSFVDKVAKGRNMSDEEVKELADGRTYTGEQALKNGLIDEISTYDEAKSALSKEAGTSQYYEPKSNTNPLASILSSAEKLVPKSEAQILIEESGKLESGVPMYYAEQLQ